MLNCGEDIHKGEMFSEIIHKSKVKPIGVTCVTTDEIEPPPKIFDLRIVVGTNMINNLAMRSEFFDDLEMGLMRLSAALNVTSSSYNEKHANTIIIDNSESYSVSAAYTQGIT